MCRAFILRKKYIEKIFAMSFFYCNVKNNATTDLSYSRRRVSVRH